MRRLISIILVLAMVFSLSATAFAASNSPYVEGNPENIVVTFNQLNGSTYQVTIRNDRDTAIGNWKLSFKTNFKLSGPAGVEWSVSKNNTYSFWDAACENIASGESFSFTVVSNKKKNSEIHNVSFEYEEVGELDPYEVFSKDADNDGLPDAIEDYLGTDPNKSDTDGDGLPDYDEVYVTLTAPDKKDSTGLGIGDGESDYDADGLTNLEEVYYGTDPYKEDTDKDGLSDSDEIVLGTDPLNSDTDSDGMLDGTELPYGMIPTNPDTLNDGILDGDRLFDVVLENSDAYGEYGLLASVKIPLLGKQIQTLNVKKVDTTDVFLSEQVPGFIGNAFDYTVDGDFESAEISFTFPEELFSDPDFEPAIFYFDEEDQLLVLLENQTVSGNTVSVCTPHFSRYIILNKTEYEKVWVYEIKYNPAYPLFEKIDVAFVIDSSGSMSSNDNSGIRKSVTKEFIRQLSPSDRAAIIDFDSSAVVYTGFSNDQTTLFNAVDRINSSGGTNLSTGIQAAINLFTDESYANHSVLKLIVMLTDGDGSYNTNLTQTAKNNGIIIYTVGLGNSVSVSRLTSIAKGTDGQYYPASDAQKLYEIFDEIVDEADLHKDTDADGITDYFEKEMSAGRLTLGSGVPLLGMDYQNADSDGDTLKDGEEISVKQTKKLLNLIGSERIYVKLYSNPTAVDTDGDGIIDPKDERALYAFRFQYLGSKEHLEYVKERMPDKLEEINLRGEPRKTNEGRLGTEILINDYYDFLAHKGIDPSGKRREEYWEEDWYAYWDAYCDKINEYVFMKGSVDTELHYFRNNLNRIPATLDMMIADCKRWTLLPVESSSYHMFKTEFSGDGVHNLKFISNDGKYEAVYVNKYGNPYENESDVHYNGMACTDETDPTNMGTYNYSGGYVSDGIVSIAGEYHFILDMLPYYVLGNTASDSPVFIINTNEDNYTDNIDAQTARTDFLNEWGGGKQE